MKTYEEIQEMLKQETAARDRMEPLSNAWYFYDGKRRAIAQILGLEE
jgi:hypothetical protein